ncbi:MAG: hypothetical protein AAGC92_16390 [Pseudomonadota bacterium]
MTDKEAYELELIKAQTALALKQSQTEFWKVGIALIAAGALVGGFVVGSLL